MGDESAEKINQAAERISNKTNLTYRQAQVTVALSNGLTVEDIVDLYDGEWGVTGRVSRSHVVQAVEGAKKKYIEARELLEYAGEYEEVLDYD